jgi:hypothetical protein
MKMEKGDTLPPLVGLTATVTPKIRQRGKIE